MKNPYLHLAGRFAAKESYLKALGRDSPGGDRSIFQEIEVIPTASGRPEISVRGWAEKIAKKRKIRPVQRLHFPYIPLRGGNGDPGRKLMREEGFDRCGTYSLTNHGMEGRREDQGHQECGHDRGFSRVPFSEESCHARGPADRGLRSAHRMAGGCLF